MAFGISAGAWLGAAAAVGSAAISSSAASSAADAQSAAAAESAQVQREQLEFQKKQYNDWKEIYGPLQESQAEYYKNLTGKELTGRELEQIQRAGQAANTQIEQSLAQRGMGESGLLADLTNQNIYNTEMQKALSRASAPERAALEKNKFLALGLNQGQGIMNQMSNSANGLSQSIIAGGNAQAAGITNSANAWSTAISYSGRTISSALTNYGQPSGYMPQDDGILY